MIELIKTIVQSLENNKNIVVATIVTREGSSPRHSGAKLMVTAEGGLFGTVGGGLLEADVIRSARQMLTLEKTDLLKFDLAGRYLSTGAMICGGYTEILVQFIRADAGHLELFQTLQLLQQKRQSSHLITWLKETEDLKYHSYRCLLDQDGNISGEKRPGESTLEALKDVLKDVKRPKWLTIHNQKFWIEPLQCPKTLFLFGAGHVSQPTAELADKTGFQVTVLDDRTEFANKEHFAGSIETVVLPEYKGCVQNLEVDEDSFIVCITRGHLHDLAVVSQALKTNACYIGMIGSRKKRDIIFAQLLEEGFTQKDLKRVHCPIGLGIGAETPEEISVSVVAELIKVRSRS